MQRPWNVTPPTPQHDLRLTVAPLAWLKLVWFCHQGNTEIGGFGVSGKNRLLHVEEFLTVQQHATPVSVHFLDDAVADHFDICHERGIVPSHCGRIWIHTHPGDSAEPSGTDEETFERSFGRCDWALMMILARTGQTYARLALGAGPRAQIAIPVNVDWSAWHNRLTAKDFSLDACCQQWQQECAANVLEAASSASSAATGFVEEFAGSRPWWDENWF